MPERACTPWTVVGPKCLHAPLNEREGQRRGVWRGGGVSLCSKLAVNTILLTHGTCWELLLPAAWEFV